MASGTDERKARLFAFIQQTTKRAQAAGVVERMKAGRTVSEKTAKTYERNARARLDLSSDGGGRLLEGVSGRSFHAIRAALLHEAARLYGEARKAADEANRAGDHAGQVEAAKRARAAVEAFEAEGRREACERGRQEDKTQDGAALGRLAGPAVERPPRPPRNRP